MNALLIAVESVPVPVWLVVIAGGVIVSTGAYMAKLLLDLSRATSNLTLEVEHLREQRHLDRREDREDREARQAALDKQFADLHAEARRIHERIDRIGGWQPPVVEQRDGG